MVLLGNLYIRTRHLYHPASRTWQETVANYRHRQCQWFHCVCSRHICSWHSPSLFGKSTYASLVRTCISQTCHSNDLQILLRNITITRKRRFVLHFVVVVLNVTNASIEVYDAGTSWQPALRAHAQKYIYIFQISLADNAISNMWTSDRNIWRVNE